MYTALNAAKEYATQWGLSWDDRGCLAAGKERAWWLLFGVRYYTFTFLIAEGVIIAGISCPGYKVRRFEVYPLAGKGLMLPLWAAYPTLDSVTINWRMGRGEYYKYRWNGWYRSLADDERAEYKKRFPPPDYGAWPGFYEDIADRPSTGSIGDVIMGRV